MKRWKVSVACAALMMGCSTVAGIDEGEPLPPSECSVDGDKNGSETGVDCGGGACPACQTGEGCLQASDCLTSACTGMCSDGSRCIVDEHCASGPCDRSTTICFMATCGDGIQNGDEAGVDCGGAGLSICPRCVGGDRCSLDRDCASQLCDGQLCVPTCCSGDCGPDGCGACQAPVVCDDMSFGAPCDPAQPYSCHFPLICFDLGGTGQCR